MGLTVHYRLSYPAASADEAASAVERLRQAALDLPFEEVGELCRFEGEDCDFERWRETDQLWPLVQASRYLNLAGGVSVTVKPVAVAVFEAWPGEGCEAMEVGLARYPSCVELSRRTLADLKCFAGKRYPRKVSTGSLGRGWSWRAFCKTQYASNVSAEHFLKCHATVCALLRQAEKLGFRVAVYDEGRFWGKWDYGALAREVRVWNAHLAAVVRGLEAALGGAGGSVAAVEAPIRGNPAYYEAAGVGPEAAEVLAELARRF